MKKYLVLLLSSLILVACSETSSKFVNVSMPNFKPQINPMPNTKNSGIKVSLEPILIERNNNYSDYFENSVLKIRIEKELELLKQNLEEQMKTILTLRGYELNSNNPDYKLQTKIDVYIEENSVKKSTNFFSGDSVSSNLGLKFQGNIQFIDAHNPQNSTNITSDTALESNIALDYPIKSADGINMLKTTLSSVPTQLNKCLERPAFEIDKSFLYFYKNTLNTLYNNLPKADDSGKNNTENKKEYNEFIPSENFEENLPKIEDNPESSNQNKQSNNSKNLSGVVVFE